MQHPVIKLKLDIWPFVCNWSIRILFEKYGLIIHNSSTIVRQKTESEQGSDTLWSKIIWFHFSFIPFTHIHHWLISIMIHFHSCISVVCRITMFFWKFFLLYYILSFIQLHLKWFFLLQTWLFQMSLYAETSYSL